MSQRGQGSIFANGVIAEHRTILLVLLTGVAVVLTLHIICRKFWFSSRETKEATTCNYTLLPMMQMKRHLDVS